MEIRLKTAEEFHSAHVTIEIRATPEEAWSLSDRLYTAAEVGDAQASEAELVAGPLRRRIAELERTLAREVNRNTDLEAQAEDADRRINALTGQVKGYDHDRHTEKERADRERQRADKAEGLVREELEAATKRVRAATEILSRPMVVGARNDIVTTKGAILADAIGNALDALSA
jgi:chromosome segregation ATPase